MAVIKVAEDSLTMHDVGEIDEYDDCCIEPPIKTKEKHYPNLYMYEIPDALYDTLTVGEEVTLQIKAKVTETSERVRNTEEKGESKKRTVDLSILEVSNPM